MFALQMQLAGLCCNASKWDRAAEREAHLTHRDTAEHFRATSWSFWPSDVNQMLLKAQEKWLPGKLRKSQDHSCVLQFWFNFQVTVKVYCRSPQHLVCSAEYSRISSCKMFTPVHLLHILQFLPFPNKLTAAESEEVWILSKPPVQSIVLKSNLETWPYRLIDQHVDLEQKMKTWNITIH